MKSIAVVTATRAEYGLLSPVVWELRKHENNEFRVELVVTGMHLSHEYGYTVDEIEKNGDRIDCRVPVSVKSQSGEDISRNQAEILVKFSALFVEKHYDAVILLGDRYETLAIAIAASNALIPIFHLCGGDTTEGAIDEWIRHSITKMSYLHFVTNEESRRRVIQLGEDPKRVFDYGSTSIDNVLTLSNLNKEEVLKSVGLSNCRYALCTYHPVTLEGDEDIKIEAFLDAIKHFPEIEFIVTKSNADQGGARINELLDLADSQIANLHVFASLGTRRYLSLMRYSEFVLGNSSSGIIETPALHVPTVNIGNRQRGRLQPDSIINCGSASDEIKEAITKALSDDHKRVCANVISPYGDGHSGTRIAEKIVEVILAENINLKKKFYDLKF